MDKYKGVVKFNMPWEIWNEKDKKENKGVLKFVTP